MACRIFNILNKFHLSHGSYSKLSNFGLLSTFSRCYSVYVDKDWTINDVVDHLAKPSTKNVVVMAGAGISTPSGIPDFRSPGTGLYDNLKQYNLPYAEAIFELDYFRSNPKPFFTLAKELYPGNYKPNLVHYFCTLLHHKNKLLRMYTQNIDGLERLAGIPADKLVEAHGTFATAKCMDCRKKYEGSAIRQRIMDGEIPVCATENCKGIIKPDIVFFGEQLPERFYLHAIDMEEADTLIVMGTSLEVQPFASIAMMVDDIPRILINKELVNSFVTSDSQSDVLILGDVAENVGKLVNMLKWTKDLDELMLKPT